MAHLLITLTIISIYGYTVAIGKPDTTLQNLLLIIGGFWFGAMGVTTKNKIEKNIETGKDETKT